MKDSLGVENNDQDMQDGGHRDGAEQYQPKNAPERPPQDWKDIPAEEQEELYEPKEGTTPGEVVDDFFEDRPADKTAQQQPETLKEEADEMDWTFTHNGTTYEVPEKFRNLAKDRDSAEFVKNSIMNETIRQDREDEIARQSEGYTRFVQDTMARDNAIKEAIKHNDVEFIAKKIGMPIESVYKFVEDKIRHQQQLDEGGYVPPQKTVDYEEPYRRQIDEVELKQREIDLEMKSDPQLENLRQSFDSTNGQGSFMNQLYLEGKFLEETQRRPISVREVTESLKRKFSPYLQNQPAQPPQAQPSFAPQQNYQAQPRTAPMQRQQRTVQKSGILRRRRPNIPSPGGKTGTSLRKAPKDLEDLENMVNNINNRMTI